MNPNRFLLALTLVSMAFSSVDAGASTRKVLRGQVSDSDRQLEISGRILKCNGKGKNPNCNDNDPPEDPNSGEICGTATCQPDEFCCNQSCNMCAPIGVQCPTGMCP